MPRSCSTHEIFDQKCIWCPVQIYAAAKRNDMPKPERRNYDGVTQFVWDDTTEEHFTCIHILWMRDDGMRIATFSGLEYHGYGEGWEVEDLDTAIELLAMSRRRFLEERNGRNRTQTP